MTLLARLILLAFALTFVWAGTALGASPTGNVGQNYIWNPVFADEFDGTSLDTNKWVTCYFWQVNDGCTNNDELQLYQPDDVSVGNGVLDLKAEPHGVKRFQTRKPKTNPGS